MECKLCYFRLIGNIILFMIFIELFVVFKLITADSNYIYYMPDEYGCSDAAVSLSIELPTDDATGVRPCS